ncbi:MAG: leucine-rich repeat domain-containing protein, partial [Planctomycetaceae bacterium]|nr:leucine-rich repeat domain-containing protein [Planctomycetaceae bacterium]
MTLLHTYPSGKAGANYTIPDGVTDIAGFAFNGCSSLTGITIPDSVTSIGNHAFKDCSDLENITFLGSAPTTVGAAPFSGLPASARVIAIPQALASFGDIGAAWNGLTLDCLDAVLCLLTWTTTDGEITITDCNEAATGELVIPDTIEGNPVTSIGNSAFRSCVSLTSVTIPDSLTSISVFAFANCSSLTTIEVGAGNANYTGVDGVLFNK